MRCAATLTLIFLCPAAAWIEKFSFVADGGIRVQMDVDVSGYNDEMRTWDFPACFNKIGAKGCHYPKCIGRCGAGCGGETLVEECTDVDVLKTIQIGQGNKCRAGCFNHDMCTFARECEKSVTITSVTGTTVDPFTQTPTDLTAFYAAFGGFTCSSMWALAANDFITEVVVGNVPKGTCAARFHGYADYFSVASNPQGSIFRQKNVSNVTKQMQIEYLKESQATALRVKTGSQAATQGKLTKIRQVYAGNPGAEAKSGQKKEAQGMDMMQGGMVDLKETRKEATDKEAELKKQLEEVQHIKKDIDHGLTVGATALKDIKTTKAMPSKEKVEKANAKIEDGSELKMVGKFQDTDAQSQMFGSKKLNHYKQKLTLTKAKDATHSSLLDYHKAVEEKRAAHVSKDKAAAKAAEVKDSEANKKAAAKEKLLKNTFNFKDGERKEKSLKLRSA